MTRESVAVSARRSGRLHGQQLGDAEVEQLHLAGFGDQDVGRLQVAMDHERTMGGGDRPAGAEEQLDARAQVEPVGVAVGVDRPAVHVLHREVRQPIVGDAAVEQRGDVRMRETGQDVALGEEAIAQRRIEHGRARQLERDQPLIDAVGPAGEIHHAHAAVANLPQQFVRTDLRAWRRVAPGVPGR